jgi:hypothetical protein
MKLLQNEKEIILSNDSTVVLTNYRISMKLNSWLSKYYITIFLEDVSSVENKNSSKLIYIIYSLLSLFIAFLLDNSYSKNYEYIKYAGFFMAIVFFYYWWSSRKNIISISSNGGSKLEFDVNEMTDKSIEEFVHEVINAKQIRVNHLNKI